MGKQERAVVYCQLATSVKINVIKNALDEEQMCIEPKK